MKGENVRKILRPILRWVVGPHWQLASNWLILVRCTWNGRSFPISAESGFLKYLTSYLSTCQSQGQSVINLLCVCTFTCILFFSPHPLGLHFILQDAMHHRLSVCLSVTWHLSVACRGILVATVATSRLSIHCFLLTLQRWHVNSRIIVIFRAAYLKAALTISQRFL